MPQTSQQLKEAARRRQANKRARDRGEPEPYPMTERQEAELASAVNATREADFAYAQSFDATGQYFKSECRTLVQLHQIYYGATPQSSVGEEVDDTDDKTGQKKVNLPKPYRDAVRIYATREAVDGEVVLLDPVRENRKKFEVSKVVSFVEWLDLRDKARKDLFWLGRLLDYQYYHGTHQQICDMFVQKNFDGMYFEGFTRDDLHDMIERQERFMTVGDGTQVPTRTMMLFAPRSSYKSTIDGTDVVQWMLNCPDIRILILTSVLRLSKELMNEIKKHFYLAPLAKATSFQILFPEYIITGVQGKSKQALICPAQMFNSKEPHLWVTSLDSSFVGSRCDIRKIDDSVEDKNSNTNDLRDSLKAKIAATNALVEPWGFTDIIGTRYFTNDWYGWRMGQVPDPDDPSNSTEPYRFLSLSAWWPKPEHAVRYAMLLEKPGGLFEVTEDMVELLFPSKLSFKTLRTKLKEYKERGFKNQYLNIATDPMESTEYAVHFDRETLRRATYARNMMPETGEDLVCVDWAYTADSRSDWTVFAAVRRHERVDGSQELIVKEVEYGKYKATDIASRLVLFLREHKPRRTFIEQANGYDLLISKMADYANRYGCPEVMWSIFPVKTGNEAKSKSNRIKTLEILLADERLHFVSGPWVDELYNQFERFTGETKMGRKDDIPDAISMASRTLPASMFAIASRVDPEEERQLREAADKEARKRAHYNQYFGQHYYAVDTSDKKRGGGGNNNPPPTEHAPTWRELPPPIGRGRRQPEPEKPAEPEPEKPKDPRMRIFGNKGPWRL